jgi:dipeptidyl aminopeptidase/acylaminoacyl peptidase
MKPHHTGWLHPNFRRRGFRYILMLLAVGFITAGAVILIPAWQFVQNLTSPDCPAVEVDSLREDHQYIELKTADGYLVRGLYYPSANGAAVIALGGTAGALGRQTPDVSPLLEAGFGIIQVGTRACTPAPITLSGDEIHEAIAAYEFLASQDTIDPERIGVFGFSMGAATAIRAAARDPRIAAVVAQGGFHNLGHDFEEPDLDKPLIETLTLRSVSAIFALQTGIDPWTISPIEDLPRISPRPVFLIYGEHEALSGHAQEQLAAAAAPKSLWIIPDGDHLSIPAVAADEYAAKVLDFFESALLR